jgi:Protein of unknown function (DUF3540)
MVAATVREIHRPMPEVEEYLGPASVTEVHPHELVVTLPDGAATRAALALALPYSPVVGDVLLVIGRASKYYAIGVLQGSGETAMVFQGDVQLRSSNGRLTLTGDRGVDIRGAELEIQTGALRMLAREVVQRFDSVCQRVTALIRVHAGETHTFVKEGALTQANSATILTEEAVTINGREIHLG